MQTVFVTGGEGFTGSRMMAYLAGKGYDVVAGVRNRARKLAYERCGTKAMVCEMADAINVARVIASVRPDVVVHLAGTTDAGAAAEEPLTAYQCIVTAWANLLDAVRRTVPRAKVVLASACDVYGNAGSDGEPLSETSQCQPISTFGSLKLTAEEIAHTFHRDYHLDITIARPFHYTGAGQSDNYFFGAVARILAEWDYSTHGSELRLPDLDCRRDLLHVDDVVLAYECLISGGRPNEVYNICGGQVSTCRGIVESMLAEFDLKVELTDYVTVDDDIQVPVLLGDNRKISEDLNWAPSASATAAIHDLVAGYQTAPAGVGN